MKDKTRGTERKKWSRKKKLVVLLLGLILAGCLTLALINAVMLHRMEPYILTREEASELEDVDCIMILGAGLWNGEPSPILQQRLDQGLALWQEGVSPKLLMSGDHGREEYNEVGTMKAVAMAAPYHVPSSDVFMDHAGFSTYESMVRAKEVFGVKKMIIVTQEYHLTRALYAARSLGIDAYGCAASTPSGGQMMRDIREVIARAKEVMYVTFGAKPTYLGDMIPIQGDGDLTNDEK